MQVDFGASVKVTQVQVEQGGPDLVTAFRLRYSDDGIAWADGATVSIKMHCTRYIAWYWLKFKFKHNIHIQPSRVVLCISVFFVGNGVGINSIQSLSQTEILEDINFEHSTALNWNTCYVRTRFRNTWA